MKRRPTTHLRRSESPTTACCDRHPLTLPTGDRLVFANVAKVTCGKGAAA